jgi:hypothetical protein
VITLFLYVLIIFLGGCSFLLYRKAPPTKELRRRKIIIALFLLALFLVSTFFISFASFDPVPKRSKEQEKKLQEEWGQYLQKVETIRRQQESALEKDGIEKNFIAAVDLKKKPWISIFVWEDVAVLYPKTFFDQNCAFQVFYNNNEFVWDAHGIYMSNEHREKKTEWGKFVEIVTYPSKAFDLLKKGANHLNLRVKGLPLCVEEIDYIKIETRSSK